MAEHGQGAGAAQEDDAAGMLVTSGRARGKGQGLSLWGHALCRVTLSTTEESWTL